MTCSKRKLDFAKLADTETARAASLAASAVIVVLAVAAFEGRAGAGCPGYTTSYHSSKTDVPCSDTTTCFDPGTQSFNCDSGTQVLGYKNMNPPNAWYNCTPVSGGGSCSESNTGCGTTQWFSSSTCNAALSCTVTPGKVVSFCEAAKPPQ